MSLVSQQWQYGDPEALAAKCNQSSHQSFLCFVCFLFYCEVSKCLWSLWDHTVCIARYSSSVRFFCLVSIFSLGCWCSPLCFCFLLTILSKHKTCVQEMRPSFAWIWKHNLQETHGAISPSFYVSHNFSRIIVQIHILNLLIFPLVIFILFYFILAGCDTSCQWGFSLN